MPIASIIARFCYKLNFSFYSNCVHVYDDLRANLVGIV